ncbi:MAG: iron-containing alcohol dehydrogenase [Gammaproteobacteria bacterium]|nr:iron-containing alcohol dehydrogenase [Gammaproteobacteria bacterium]
MSLFANWSFPTKIRVGQGRTKEVVKICQSMNIDSPLVVCDENLVNLPFFKTLLSTLEALNFHIFSEVKSNPTVENINKGVESYKSNQCDGVIAIGGGSAIDAGKAIAMMSGQPGELLDYVDKKGNWKKIQPGSIAPIIAIPTTAGTGSEVGNASVVSNPVDHSKNIIFHPDMVPQWVILDPDLTVGLPANLTAATGMDAFAHNLEAYCVSGYHPMADGIAIQGMKLVKEYLPQAVKDGSNIEARTQMLVASTMGATAFQKGLGGIHALSHTLGGLFDSHHGLLNAVLMPYVLKQNRASIEEKIAQLAHHLQLQQANFDGFINLVLEIRKEIGIPHSLSEIGINSESADFDKAKRVGELAVNDSVAAGNPIAYTAEEYQQIFERAVAGDL